MRNRHRLFGQIAAGADDRSIDGRHQQVMQRRVGQHDAQVRIAGGDATIDGREARGESDEGLIGCQPSVRLRNSTIGA